MNQFFGGQWKRSDDIWVHLMWRGSILNFFLSLIWRFGWKKCIAPVVRPVRHFGSRSTWEPRRSIVFHIFFFAVLPLSRALCGAATILHFVVPQNIIRWCRAGNFQLRLFGNDGVWCDGPWSKWHWFISKLPKNSQRLTDYWPFIRLPVIFHRFVIFFFFVFFLLYSSRLCLTLCLCVCGVRICFLRIYVLHLYRLYRGYTLCEMKRRISCGRKQQRNDFGAESNGYGFSPPFPCWWQGKRSFPSVSPDIYFRP